VKVFLTDDDFKTLTKKEEENKGEIKEKFDTKNIVYEDGDILVINKEP
jgi:23S rRNA-/tRNA-specific pseudouridylate synthase